MAEFVAEIEDWSLQAIVRGSSGDYTKNVDIDMDDDQTSLFDLSANHHDQKFDSQFLASFPEIFEVLTGSSDELEELYKPFYPVSHAVPAQTVIDFQEKQPQIDVAEDKQQALDQLSGSSSVPRVTSGYTPKYKKRKNQQKRVVMQVSAEGLASDMWAWRKYGQKPIKGSPYPRSYYRCSSLKGCLARKQVEKSCKDPGMFIITYTAEHSHSLPTRRNSLAGTVRQKFPSKNPNNKIAKQEKANQESSSRKAEVANFNQTKIKEENKGENEEVVKGESHNVEDFMMSDFVFNEDFFSGLEDFEELISEMPMCHAQQFPVRSCS